MVSSLLQDYEEDVKDSRKALIEAAQEIEDAVQWHQKMLAKYAADLKRLDDYKKDV